jgi:hypothetical protein
MTAHLRGDAQPEQGELEEVRIEQRRLALALAPDQPAGERPERDHADRDQEADELPAFLPDEDADHDSDAPSPPMIAQKTMIAVSP